MKTCTVCRRLLPRDAFGLRSASRDGLNFRCRACNSARSQQSKRDHRPVALARRRARVRATQRLITRHRAEFDALVEAETEADLAGRRQETP